MAAPSVTYSFTDGTVARAGEVNQNFTDAINGMSDGTKTLNVAACEVASCSTATAGLVAAAMDSTAANAVVSMVASSGANALFAQVSSCNSTVANLIGSSMTATGANAVLASISTSTSGSANTIANARTRAIVQPAYSSTPAAVGKVAVSDEPGLWSGSSSGSEASAVIVTALSVNLLTTGKPVKVEYVNPSNASASLPAQFKGENAGANWNLVVNTVVSASTGTTWIVRSQAQKASTTGLYGYPAGSFNALILSLPSDTYSIYTKVWGASTVYVYGMKMVAYEI